MGRIQRLTLQDVARTAGVSLATVDRVLNERAGVNADTARRVRAVMESLNYVPDRHATRLARGANHRFAFVLSEGANEFMDMMHDEVTTAARVYASERIELEVVRADVFDGAALARTLRGLKGRFAGVATVALDHPSVREAIDDLVSAGIPVVTVVSDAPQAARAHYVGIDNVAAGRTAGSLLGRFVGAREGKVGVIAGSLALRDHIERRMGFEQVMEREFPALDVLPVREGRDADARVEKLAATLLEDAALVGLYCVGAGTDGLVAALEASGRDAEVTLVAHELTHANRRHLLRGAVDAIINQDAGHEVRSAVRLLLAAHEKTQVYAAQERIRIDVFLRENVPSMTAA